MPPLESVSPPSSPTTPLEHEDINGDSPQNTIGSDIDYLYANLEIDLAALTIFDKIPSVSKSNSIISVPSTSNTNRKKPTPRARSSRVWGRVKTWYLFHNELLDLTDVLVSSADEFRALKAFSPQEGSQ